MKDTFKELISLGAMHIGTRIVSNQSNDSTGTIIGFDLSDSQAKIVWDDAMEIASVPLANIAPIISA